MSRSLAALVFNRDSGADWPEFMSKL